MPSCSTHIVTDADEFRTVIRPVDGEMTVTASGRFEATVIRVDLHRLWLQLARESLPRTWYSEMSSFRAGVSFLMHPGAAIHQGVELETGHVALLGPCQPTWQRLGDATRWGSVSLPLEDWTEVGSVVAGRELMPPKGSLPIRPRASALATLQRLHSATAHIAETAPELIQNPEVARGLEQGLIHATVDCLSPLSPREGTIAQRHHTKIMMQFRKMLEEHADKAVYVPELCAAIGVSDRTLRLCFQEHLGISPKRYLFLRRMTFAKRALRDANPTSTNVTEIAMQLGFWELGRFAVAYRSLFGELPSTTLRQAPQ